MPPRHPKKSHRAAPSGSYLTDDALALDSESAAPAPVAPTAEVLPPRTNEQLNLAVLQRHYPEVAAILSIANFATLYTLQPATQAWDKANCDGTLFVCALIANENAAERYALVILNRRELKNFYLELLSPSLVEYAEPFIMLDDTNGKVSGIFISAEPEPASTWQMRELNVGVIQECAARAEESRGGPGAWAEDTMAEAVNDDDEGEEDDDVAVQTQDDEDSARAHYISLDGTSQHQQHQFSQRLSYQQPAQQSWPHAQPQQFHAPPLIQQQQPYQQQPYAQQQHLPHHYQQQQQQQQPLQQLGGRQATQSAQAYLQQQPQLQQHNYQQNQQQYQHQAQHQQNQHVNNLLGLFAPARASPTYNA